MSSMDLRVGGKYRIGKKIGSGSFGELEPWSGGVRVNTPVANHPR
jgi:hypothetical protein